MTSHADNDSPFEVFISHSSLDDPLAKAVQELLAANGIKAFCTPDSIPSGMWEKQIEDALEQASDIWVLLTANALERSVWAHQEMGYFYGFHKGADPDGRNTHYLFEHCTSKPGLYAHKMEDRMALVGDRLPRKSNCNLRRTLR